MAAGSYAVEHMSARVPLPGAHAHFVGYLVPTFSYIVSCWRTVCHLKSSPTLIHLHGKVRVAVPFVPISGNPSAIVNRVYSIAPRHFSRQ